MYTHTYIVEEEELHVRDEEHKGIEMLQKKKCSGKIFCYKVK